MEGLGLSPEEKNIFCPKNNNFDAVFDRFYGSIAKRSLQKQCKNIQKFTVGPKRAAVT